MSGTILPNLGLTGDIPDHAAWGIAGRANDRRLDALVMPAVKSILNDPPGSPADGDRYLIGTAPTGAWATHANAVVAWNAALATWVYYVPKTGWREYVESVRARALYSGAAWATDDAQVSVKNYGATGDGVTNDSAAVLAAITAAPAGSKLYFPAGTYLLSTWAVYTLAKSLWICGDGAGVTILKSTGPAANVLGTDFLSITAGGFRCSDLTIDGVGVAFNFSAAASIIEKALIENVEIKNFLRGVYGSNAIVITVSAVDTGTETITAAVAHGLSINDQLVFANTAGALPGGITAGVTYYVKTTPSSATLTLSATLGGATLNLTTTGSGNNTAYRAGLGVRGVRVRACRLDAGQREGIYLNLGVMEHVYLGENIITNVVGKGIDLGGNALALADVRGEYVIENNIIDGVSNIVPVDTAHPGGIVSGLAAGIVCYGWRAVITGNTVSNISKLDPNASDCDGIYTKCRYTVIADNLLIDASQAEAAINVKGGAKNETVVQPYGFTVLVASNVILDTQVNPLVSAGTFKRSNGIKIATSEVMVMDNYLEGLCEVGIYTDSDTGSDAPCHNVTVTGNVIKNHRGKIAIDMLGRGDRVRVVNNLVETVLNTYDDVTLPQPFGILMAKKEGTGTDVIGNRVFNIQGGVAGSVGISIKPAVYSFDVSVVAATDTFTSLSGVNPVAHVMSVNDQVRFVTDGVSGVLPTPLVAGTYYFIKTVPTSSTFTISATLGGATLDITSAGTPVFTVQRKMTRASWRVMDNHVDTAQYGVQFTWDETILTVDDVLVRHNTGRNLNGNVIPLLADVVKYTDTPTNLIDLPAQMPVVSYESPDRAAIYQPSGADHPQEMRVYRNRIDASGSNSGNFERVVMRAKSSAFVIGTEFSGNVDIGAGTVTAVKRALEFGVAQTAGVAITSYWRISTAGNFEPLTNALSNIGSASLGVASVFVTGDLDMTAGGNATIILPGTTAGASGAVTINKVCGQVLVAAGATSLVLTNSKLSATSKTFCQIAKADTANPRIKSVVYSASGGAHVTITLDVAPAADLPIDFLVINSA